MNIDTFRAIVRPTITWGLVLAQIALAFMWAGASVSATSSAIPATTSQAASAFAALGPFTMMAMTFWFRARDDKPPA